MTRINAESPERFAVGSDAALSSNNRVRTQSPGLFINLGSPSVGEGLVQSWHFCYSCPNSGEYRVVFMVYRPDSGSQRYEMVPGSALDISVVCEQRNSVQCVALSLVTGEHFLIQTGDVVAACLPGGGRDPVRMTSSIGNGSQSETSAVYQYSDNGIDSCGGDLLRTVDSPDLAEQSGTLLHLYAVAVPGNS